MYCPKCGTQNPADARFCGNCAAPMPTVATAASATDLRPAGTTVAGGSAAAAVATPEPAAVSSGMNVGIIAATVVIPIVGIIMGVIYRLDANPAKRSAGTVWLIVGIVVAVVWLALLSDPYLYY